MPIAKDEAAFRTSRRLEPQLLQELIACIVQVARPDRIVLFGSAARGEMGPDSDVDVLVIKSGVVHRRQLAQTIHHAVRDLPISLDVLVATPEDVEAHRNALASVIGVALREGVDAYAA